MERRSRLRGPNFTSSDIRLLCNLLFKHRHIIQNKKIDGANILQKRKAWLEVTKEYNSATTGHPRTVQNLQQNYKNLKRKAKKKASNAKIDAKIDIPPGKEAALKCEDDPLSDKVKDVGGLPVEGLYIIDDGDNSIISLQNLPQTGGEQPSLDACQSPIMTPDVSQDSPTFLINESAKLHELLSCETKLESQLLEKQSVSEKFKTLASERMKTLEMQKELLKLQLTEEREKLEHNRLLRAMEIEDTKARYAHNHNIRKLEFEKF